VNGWRFAFGVAGLWALVYAAIAVVLVIASTSCANAPPRPQECDLGPGWQVEADSL
jgi:hypothetical protein